MDATERESSRREFGRVRRLEFEVDWPPHHAAAYLVEGDEPVLIDAGTPGEQGERELYDQLAEVDYEPADLAAAVITHPHTDHAGQVPTLIEAGVPIHSPQPALEQLQRSEAQLTADVTEVARSIGMDATEAERQAEQAHDSLVRNRRLLPPDVAEGFPFDEPLEIAGVTFDPFHTPGHQIHHASLGTTAGDERVVFSGDALIEIFRAAALHVGIDDGAYEAIDAFFAAMDNFAERDADRVFPGHGPVFTDYEGVIETTREKLEDLLTETRTAVAAVEPAPPLDVVHQRVGEVDHPARILDTLGALGTLDGRGKVRYDTSDGIRYYETA